MCSKTLKLKIEMKIFLLAFLGILSLSMGYTSDSVIYESRDAVSQNDCVRSQRRLVSYDGSEILYLSSINPTLIEFSSKVVGTISPKGSLLIREKQDNFLVLSAKAGLAREPESIVVILEDKRTYSLRVSVCKGQNSEYDSSLKIVHTLAIEERRHNSTFV